MNSNPSTAQWVVAYASVIGNGHIQQNIPCQDNCAHKKLENSPWGIAVVCDGAGSAAHSEIGSDFVSRNALHCLEEVVLRRKWETAESLPSEADWREESLKALQIVWQRLSTFAKENGYNMQDLACTTLTILYSPFAILVAHIGDGRATYLDGNEWKTLIVPFKGSEANQTVFITSNIWTKEGVDIYIRTHINRGDIRAFGLLSDGCEKGSFEVNIYDEETGKYKDLNRPFIRFFEPNRLGLLQLHKENKTQDEINALWKNFLLEGNKAFKHEVDDKTMILGVLIPEADDQAAPPAANQAPTNEAGDNPAKG